MVEKEILVHTDDGEMPVFVAHPEGGPFPMAFLYMDGVGYRQQIRENARRFATAGYYCVAPDLFYRAGKGLNFDMSKLRTAEGLASPEAKRMMETIAALTADKVVGDTEAIIAAVGSDPAADTGPKVCVGYCMGARFALHMAAVRQDFVAAAGIHPGALVNAKPDSPHLDLKDVHGELYFAFAEIDRTATTESVEQFRQEMERQGVKGVVERLPGVAHGFAMADLPVYDHGASEHHFARTLDLWRRNLPVAV